MKVEREKIALEFPSVVVMITKENQTVRSKNMKTKHNQRRWEKHLL